MKVFAGTLSVITVFKDLSPEQRERLAASMQGTTYTADQPIITQDDGSTDVYFVVSGEVRAIQYSATGKEVDFQDLYPGAMFGELAAIDKRKRSMHVVAKKESLIASMNAEAFGAAVDDFASVRRHTFERLTGLARMLQERIFEYSTLGVKNRIHAELLRLAREASPDADGEVVIDNPPTHAEIANRVATHREAVTREVKHLESMDLIEWRPKCHVIKNVGELARMVKEVRGH